VIAATPPDAYSVTVAVIDVTGPLLGWFVTPVTPATAVPAMLNCGFVPNPVPATVTNRGELAACQGDAGLTEITGVGSPTVRPTALLVPASVTTVMECVPTLLACPSTLQFTVISASPTAVTFSVIPAALT